jgi:hypothetical protein
MFTRQTCEENNEPKKWTFYGQHVPTPQDQTRTSWPITEESIQKSQTITFNHTTTREKSAPEQLVTQGFPTKPLTMPEPEAVMQKEMSPRSGRGGGKNGKGNNQKKGGKTQ